MNLDPVQRAAEEQFSRRSHCYGSGHILEKIEDVEAASRAIFLPPNAAVLDIATGGGHTGLHFARLGHRVTLADISQEMLTRAATRAEEQRVTVETRKHTAEQLPYPENSFDLVTCRVAAHHFSSPAQFVQESARVLKPAGFFLLIDGSVPDDEPEAEAWAHEVEILRDPSHHRFLTPKQWSDLCAESGMNVVSTVCHPFKQPDLDWYFETAATSPQNREAVLRLVKDAPASARRLFQLGIEDGKIVWWWQRLTLVARKPE